MSRLPRPHCPLVLVILLVSLLLLTGNAARAGSARSLPEDNALPPPPDLPTVAAANAATTVASGMSYVFPINTAETSKSNIQIAYNTNHNEYMVVWEAMSYGGTPPTFIAGQRVSASGQLIGGPFTIASNPTRSQTNPSIAYDRLRDRYLVVFQDEFANGDVDIGGRLVPWNGPSSALVAFPIAQETYRETNPRVAYGFWDNSYLVVFTFLPADYPASRAGLRTRAINYDGNLMEASAQTLVNAWDGDRWNADIVNNPEMADEFLITYEQAASGIKTKVRGMLVNQFGDWKLPQELTVADWTNYDQLRPVGATCGTGYAVVYEVNSNAPNWGVYLQLLDAAGARTGPVLQIADTTGDESGGRIACGSNFQRYLIVWSNQYAGGAYGVNARFMSPDGTLDRFFPVILPASLPDRHLDRLRPALAANSVIKGGYGFMVAWEQEAIRTYDLFDVYGRMVFTAGTYLPMVRK